MPLRRGLLATPGRGLALPPRRMVEVARDLEIRGANVAVGSICRSDFTPSMAGILRASGRATRPACEPTP